MAWQIFREPAKALWSCPAGDTRMGPCGLASTRTLELTALGDKDPGSSLHQPGFFWRHTHFSRSFLPSCDLHLRPNEQTASPMCPAAVEARPVSSRHRQAPRPPPPDPAAATARLHCRGSNQCQITAFPSARSTSPWSLMHLASIREVDQLAPPLSRCLGCPQGWNLFASPPSGASAKGVPRGSFGLWQQLPTCRNTQKNHASSPVLAHPLGQEIPACDSMGQTHRTGSLTDEA